MSRRQSQWPFFFFILLPPRRLSDSVPFPPDTTFSPDFLITNLPLSPLHPHFIIFRPSFKDSACSLKEICGHCLLLCLSKSLVFLPEKFCLEARNRLPSLSLHHTVFFSTRRDIFSHFTLFEFSRVIHATSLATFSIRIDTFRLSQLHTLTSKRQLETEPHSIWRINST